jgi:hypothetical protein
MSGILFEDMATSIFTGGDGDEFGDYVAGADAKLSMFCGALLFVCIW